MKAISVTYGRKFNLGNYETEDISVIVELEEGDKASDGLALAKKLVITTHDKNAEERKENQNGK